MTTAEPTPMQFEWRARAPKNERIHKAIIGDSQTLCGVNLTSVTCRAPIDPSRPKVWPINACRRCRRSWVPHIEREVQALATQALTHIRSNA